MSRRNPSLLIAAFSTLLLTGCMNAGQASYAFTFYDNGQLKSATIHDGKERDRVDVEVVFADGSRARYEAVNVKAFEGQWIEAEVRKHVQQNIGRGVDAVTSSVLKAILP